jgi:hypothetical protein
MARSLHKLHAKSVATIQEYGSYSDGGGKRRFAVFCMMRTKLEHVSSVKMSTWVDYRV